MEKNVNDVLQVFPWNKKQETKFKIYYNKVKIIYNNSREITFVRNSRSQVFPKNVLLKMFGNFTKKLLSWSLFLINFHPRRPATLLKRDSNTCAFLWNLRNFWRQHFLQSTFGESLWFTHTTLGQIIICIINTFYPNVPFLHPLKTFRFQGF